VIARGRALVHVWEAGCAYNPYLGLLARADAFAVTADWTCARARSQTTCRRVRELMGAKWASSGASGGRIAPRGTVAVAV
jgi:mitochondrial fission protein ELM1